ncbi:MAG: outer membrane protein assembly factor [Saprospiraceae bacterium]|nr:outer membrane protein assembly factor [Saprospiraceae bacterium]
MKKIIASYTFAILGLFLYPSSIAAQEFVENITKFFEFDVGKRYEDSTKFTSKVVLAPIASYEPSTSLGLGVGAKFLFKFADSGLETRTSNIPLSLTYTFRNQFIFYSGYTVFFNQEKYLLKGNLEYSKFPLDYFGRGSLTSEENKRAIEFDNLLIQPLLLKKVAKHLFVGGGIRYNIIFNTILGEDEGELPKGTSLQDELGSTSLGLEMAITFDSRDNVLNASTGNFLEFTHGFYEKRFGSTNKFMLTKLDFRQYFQPAYSQEDIIALQWYTRLSWNDTPPLELSTLGGSALLRGFQENRFRDRFAFFAQAEYRWQALDRIGFVFFAGAGDVVDGIDKLNWTNMKYSLGTGFRLKIVKSENLNIRFDYALGLGAIKDNNFYLGIAESF